MCRLGGEEFVLLMPKTDIRAAVHIGEGLRLGILHDCFELESGVRLRVTASIGAAALAGPADTMAALVRRADQALYAAKRAGRNRVAAAPAGLPVPERQGVLRSFR